MPASDPDARERISLSKRAIAATILSAFLFGPLAMFAPTATAIDITLATTSILGAGSIDPSGQPVNVVVGDRIRYAIIVDNANQERVEMLFTTIFYDPSQLAVISSYGAPTILLYTGFLQQDMLYLVSAPSLKGGVPGELLAVAASAPGGTEGLGPDLTATLEFEVLDATNPIDVVHGLGTGDPDFTVQCCGPPITFHVPEPTATLPFALLTLFALHTRRRATGAARQGAPHHGSR